MKNRLVITILALCLALTGCGNNSSNVNNKNMISVDEYNKVVDERDYYKEQYESLKSQQAEAASSNDISSNNCSSEISASADNCFNYYIDGLSSDEIVNECMIILNNTPESGQSTENYMSLFKNDPMSSDFNEYSMMFSFATEFDYYDNFPDKNAIIRVDAEGIGIQMDGTLATRTDINPYIQITLCIIDYDTASSVYETLFYELAPLYDKPQEKRNGTTWNAEGTYMDSSGFVRVESFVNLKKHDSGYVLKARKYIKL